MACFNDLEAVVLQYFPVVHDIKRALTQPRIGGVVWQWTSGIRSLSIVGRGARGRFCGTAERMGCMGMP